MISDEYFTIFHKRIKTIIKEEKVVPDLTYFKSLYSRIVDSVKLIASYQGLPEVEDTLLEEFYTDAERYYISNNPIHVERFSTLSKGYKTWLSDNRKKEIKWNYRNRYLTYLVERAGRAEKVINDIQDSSFDILGKLGDPESHTEFLTRGLVVGSVQSGKTGNFNAVINSAIDAGYKLIIVLAGLYNDLRCQTQLRIEKEVIGTGIIDIEKGRKGVVGVGEIKNFSNSNEIVQVRSITSYIKDFDKSLGDADFNPYAQRNILVCKKNTSVLRNLLTWLNDYKEDNPKYKMPLLILDDEADNASLNNSGKKGREYASTINGHIRALLDMFEKRSYLGYTATPFANVLQDRNEKPEGSWKVSQRIKGETVKKEFSQIDYIFPDDFIVLLNPPSNYIGAKEIFETIEPVPKLPLVEVVNDHITQFPTRILEETGEGVPDFRSEYEFNSNNGFLRFESYKKYKAITRGTKSYDDFPNKLTRSLKESIQCFLLTIAVRESRKEKMLNSPHYNPHNTMLIHVSRYTQWQNKTQQLVKEYLKEIKASLENEEITSPIFSEFKHIWLKYYSKIVGSVQEYLKEDYVDPYMVPISFDTIQKRYLVSTLENLDVKAINSITKETLDYPKNSPQKVIAIGGNRLSRGFTLEGLSVNYFIRTTNYSDTLFQMGRWFGYRPGYLDCCKLFATQDSILKFDTTTRVIEELESEFRKMEEKERSPKDFELRVRKHPGTLKITRPAILNSTNTKEVKWSYQDQLEMTTRFLVTKKKMQEVWCNFKNRIAPKFDSVHSNGDMLYYETDINGITEILQSENNFNDITCSTMIRFLELCQQKGKLRKWTIALKTKGDAKQDVGKGVLRSSEIGLKTGLINGITMAVRTGPTSTPKNAMYRERLLKENIFRPTGKSANIMTSPKDFSILLDTDNEIPVIKNRYIDEKIREFQKKDPSLSREDARKKIKQIPERVYRENFSEQEGILVIYLFDTYYSLLQHKGAEDKEFAKYIEDHKIDLDTPLVGYAIGFPPIEDDPGGDYIQGDYILESVGEDDYEESKDDSELPEDSIEVVYEY